MGFTLEFKAALVHLSSEGSHPSSLYSPIYTVVLSDDMVRGLLKDFILSSEGIKYLILNTISSISIFHVA